MKKNFVEELKWRGMWQDATPGVEDVLNSGSVKGYIGFDPTADSLGVGNLVQIMTLTHFQNCGHKPFVLIGGATGMVGDPSFKSDERNLLSKEQLQHNLDCQRKQLGKFLRFGSGESDAVLVNNYDWFKDRLFLDFIRDVGKHITVNYMLAKDSVKSRMETGISFTEFSYQLIQGYDFFHLWKNEGVKLQLGGSDQWGNITTGTELIRRMGGGSAYAITTPLIKKADGTKFGKSESGNIWLDPTKTSPYKFYQFWLNAADEDVKNYIRIFSVKDRAEIEALEEEHFKAPHLRLLQKSVAMEVTERVHGKDELENAIRASEILFGKAAEKELRSLDAHTLDSVFEGVPQFHVDRAGLATGIPIVEFLAEKTQILSSKGEARKLVQANGVSVNKTKVGPDFSVGEKDVLNDRYIIAQTGRKNYYLVIVD